MITIHDHIDNATYEIEDRFELEDKLYELFDVKEDGAEEAIEAICKGVVSGEYIGNYEAFLNISIER